MKNIFRRPAPAPVRVVTETDASLKSLPKEFLNKTSVAALNAALQNGGGIFTLRRGDACISLAVLSVNGDSLNLGYIMTKPDERHKGYASFLLSELLGSPVIGKRKITAGANEENPSFAEAKKLLEKAGFVQNGRYYQRVVTLEKLDAHYMDRHREALAAYTRQMESKGYRCVSFAEAEESLLLKVKDSDRNEFKNPLRPGTYFEKPEKIKNNCSFVLYRGDELIGYVLLCEIDRWCISLEQMAVSEKCRNSGFFGCLLLRCYEAVKRNGYAFCSYKVFDYNAPCLSVADALDPPETRNAVFSRFERKPTED